MKSVSDEMINAWLDGEGADDERSEVEAAIAASPELGLHVAKLARANRLLAPAFESTLNAPIPARFEALIEASRRDGALVRFRNALAAAFAPRPVMAAAASLLVGVFLGGAVLAGMGTGADVASDAQGRMIANGKLATSLASLPSGANADAFRIRLSIVDDSGRYCRQFETGAAAGLACLESDGWSIEALQRTNATSGTGGGYVLADGVADAAISATIERIGLRQVLDNGEEAAAIAAHWRGQTD